MFTTAFYKKLIIFPLLGLAFLPLAVSPNTLFPFVFAKTGATRLLIAVFWIILAIAIFREKETLSVLNWRFLKSRLFLSVFSFISLAGISTILAPSTYRAFFGTLERGEGYIHLIYLLLFLAGVSLVFGREEWFLFFKLSLFTGVIISYGTVQSYIEAGTRASGFFINNPAFISTYLLFVIFCALATLIYENKKIWRIISFTAISASVAGLAVANTRGAIVGLGAALFITALYLVLRADKIELKILSKHFNIRKLATVFLVLITSFVFVFTFTLRSPVWDKVPGLDRLTDISVSDSTVQSRLIATKISFDSINPANAGFGRFLLGWGPDNYNVAFNTYFDPTFQRYELKLFDRAHNKVMDVFVMQGLVGLIAYSAIWFYVIRAVLNASLDNEDKRKELLLRSSMIFFGVTYFVQSLFLFDHVSIHIPLFIFFGFVIYLSQEKEQNHIPQKFSGRLIGLVSAVIGVSLILIFIIYSFIPYRQMSKLVEGLRIQNPTFIVEHLDEIANPFNYAQAEIRKKLVLSVADIINNPEAKPLIDEAWILLEEIISIEPQEPRNIKALALSYQTYGENNNSPELIERAEELLRQGVELVPGRQETLFLLAKNLIAQERLEEAFSVTDELLATDPESANANLYYSMIMSPLDWDGGHRTDKIMADLFDENNKAFNIFIDINEQHISDYRNMHRLYLAFYYEQRDRDAFENVLLRAIKMEDTLGLIQKEQVPNGVLNEPVESMKEVLEQILSSFNQAGWDGVSF